MLKKIVEPLLKWYQIEKRDLPWRKEKNPYYTWVSEIMLQQTRVEAVKPFFHRFISELPTIRDLASCEEERLLKLWEGLGYYNRVRNMQKAAILVVESYDSKLPNNYEELLKLPGIGSYTAGAIGSIGFNLPVPAVDGNVLRVISRITESYEDIMKASVRKSVEQALTQIMPTDVPGEFNQALMELGATVCVPNGVAKCEQCPLATICKAHSHNTVSELPVKTAKKARKIEERTVFIIQDGDKVAIQKRPSKGLLAGLYELPNIQGHLTEEEVLTKIEEYGFEALHIQQLEPAKHIFSHIEWRMIGYRIRVTSLEHIQMREENGIYGNKNTETGKDKKMTVENEQPFIFADQQTAEKQYAIPAAFASYVTYMKIKLGQDKYKEE